MQKLNIKKGLMAFLLGIVMFFGVAGVAKADNYFSDSVEF